jgi:hypothetical protein
MPYRMRVFENKVFWRIFKSNQNEETGRSKHKATKGNRNLIRKPQGKGPLGRNMRRWKAGNDVDLGEIRS